MAVKKITYNGSSKVIKRLCEVVNGLIDAAPTVNDGKLTIQQNGTTVGTFTANQASNTTVNLTGGGTTYTAGDGIDITSGVISLDYLKVVNGAVCIKYDE